MEWIFLAGSKNNPEEDTWRVKILEIFEQWLIILSFLTVTLFRISLPGRGSSDQFVNITS